MTWHFLNATRWVAPFPDQIWWSDSARIRLHNLEDGGSLLTTRRALTFPPDKHIPPGTHAFCFPFMPSPLFLSFLLVPLIISFSLTNCYSLSFFLIAFLFPFYCLFFYSNLLSLSLLSSLPLIFFFLSHFTPFSLSLFLLQLIFYAPPLFPCLRPPRSLSPGNTSTRATRPYTLYFLVGRPLPLLPSPFL